MADEARDSFGEPQRCGEVGGALTLVCGSDGVLDEASQLVALDEASPVVVPSLRISAVAIKEGRSRHDLTLAGHLSRERDGQRA